MSTGTGSSRPHEYKSVMAQLGDFNVTETVAQSVIRAVDANGDGKISWDEFWAAQQA